MPVKIKYPSALLSKTPTPDLEVIPPALGEGNPVGAHRIDYDPDCPMPEFVHSFSDGHRLFISSPGDQRYFENSYLIYFYLFGFVGLMVLLVTIFGEGEAESGVFIFPFVMSLLFPYAIIATIIRNKRPLTQFTVFDRDSGNVLFTGRKKWPDLSVPFEHVGMFTDHRVGRGGMHFSVKLDCRMRPKSMKKGRRMEMFMPNIVNDWEETMKQWAYLNRFMDKTKPFPREPVNPWACAQWFAERNITMDDVMKKNGYVIADPETNWFKWDGTIPVHQHNQTEAGVKV